MEQITFFTEHKVASTIKYCIVIPVKDEEKYILKTLNAFINQVFPNGEKFDFSAFEILLLANNCTDSSASIIKDFQIKHPELNIYLQEITLPEHQANIGFIRRNLMDTAYIRLMENNGGIILTTDGDTEVSTTWVSQNSLEIENGAEAVGGRILLFENELQELDDATFNHHKKDEEYALLVANLECLILGSFEDPWPKHHQHFNGSFAITTECFARSGGIPDVKFLEDCAFFEVLKTVDAKIKHSNNVKVHTSARYIGRTEVGLSFQLNQWKNFTNKENSIFVESCSYTVFKFNLRKKLQNLWITRDSENFDFNEEFQKIDSRLIFNDEILRQFKSGIYFGEFFAQIIRFNEQFWRERFTNTSIDIAIRELKDFIKNYSDISFSHKSIL
ncbi:glycosyltransferase [Frigoriflavimonas asaccharolytica]|uniref:Glycosyltransferase involved in cell wall biosynthesis n=1 Tax=Frigoriflavimonas asaccharolytica TaxID=2735899 RepID=A0A8J8G911_9FLAO|nr:glycosyltransferase [Frigoriflavimonas asaccharolytica]NRS92915.1 glycosyltransferase involved in cell wall biosynthesis [Frigoriflavimonas asaccharolytica]